MITITTEDAVQAVKDVVAEHASDYRYTPPANTRRNRTNIYGHCFYVHDAVMRGDDDHERLDVGCIAAAALNKLGVSVQDMYEIEATGESPDVLGLATRLLNDQVADVSPGAVSFLRAAQVSQDEGKPWRAALIYALGDSGIRGDGDVIRSEGNPT